MNCRLAVPKKGSEAPAGKDRAKASRNPTGLHGKKRRGARPESVSVKIDTACNCSEEEEETSGLTADKQLGNERDPRAILQRLGPGRALDGIARGRMETAYGTDLRPVRIHTGPEAASLATKFGAAAFTVGQHIAFAPGQYRPGTRVGDALLAHELAHTMQQRGSTLVSSEASPGKESGLENDANFSARRALRALWMGGQQGAEARAEGVMPRMRSATHLSMGACSKGEKPADGACGLTGKFTDIPTGNLTATMDPATGRLGKPFNMKAKFKAVGDNCDCHCGEYRQYIKGTFKGNGTVIPLAQCGGNVMSATTYQEDEKQVGGTCFRYGYRSHRWVNSKFEGPDQATGCRFNGYDDPGIAGPSGDRVEMDLGFKGELIDTCNANAVLATQEWTVKGSGMTP